MIRGLTEAELKAQGARCPCRGADDYCVCQNVPDRITSKEWGLADHHVRAAPTVGESIDAMVASRRTLAVLTHDLRKIHQMISDGIAKHGAYNVPWGVLSWSMDTAGRGAEAIEEIIGPVCRQCDGLGIVANPDARYYYDHDTGFDSTNDPEEIECPHCDGTGMAPPPHPFAERQFTAYPLDDELPF